jgi:hypothetical protein
MVALSRCGLRSMTRLARRASPPSSPRGLRRPASPWPRVAGSILSGPRTDCRPRHRPGSSGVGCSRVAGCHGWAARRVSACLTSIRLTPQSSVIPHHVSGRTLRPARSRRVGRRVPDSASRLTAVVVSMVHRSRTGAWPCAQPRAVDRTVRCRRQGSLSGWATDLMVSNELCNNSIALLSGMLPSTSSARSCRSRSMNSSAASTACS